ncbi:MAG: prephenate dehydrogenase/arogenate dehydrogenase family protein, partial [candidate division Zixibacteria bacterium]|nr:prephenate dehydrogenase/arogenate dehydrogenase family protein [candidate division Zixibacteria bacterium]
IDTGAVKLPILNLSLQLSFPDNTQFLPTHPMAGREKAGFENSDPLLFENHCWFCDDSVTLNKVNKSRLDWMVKKLRTKPTFIRAKVHDELMAEISHLPQLISTILGGQVATDIIPLAGPGLRSMLRLSGSPYSVWSEIIDQNRPEIIKSLENFRNNLNKVIGMVRSKDSLANIFKASARSYECL